MRLFATIFALLAVAGCGGITSVNPSTNPAAPGDPGSGNPGTTPGTNPTPNPTPDPTPDPTAPPPDMAGVGSTTPPPTDGYLTANQKAVAEAMTSIWENDT